MSKAKKSKITPKSTEPKEMFGLSLKHQTWLFIGLLVLIVSLVNSETAFQGLAPQGTDVVAGVGKTKLIKDFALKTGETALWNPSIFAGMPKYNDMAPKSFSVDTFLNMFNGFLGKIYIYYLFAAIGMFLFLRYLKMPPIIAFIGALMFILLPYYKGLWIEGHFRKFRALMYLPWILYSFKYFLDKKSLLSTALFALAFGIQIRTGHYQIIFYTAVLIFSVGVYPFLKLLYEKKTIEFIKSFGLLVLALVLSLGMAAQPLFLNKEYLPYSKRGKTTIDLKQKNTPQNAAKTDGVTMNYATQWSTHPLELTRLILPNAYGGIDGQKYTGKEYPHLANQKLPNYWGQMPFHTMIDYVGIITIMLAFIALFVLRKDKMVLSLGLFSLFLILLSFGKFFESFYSLFYNYFPYFNKFRAPTMSITVTTFAIITLAAYGLNYLYKSNIELISIKKNKEVFYVIGGFAFIGFIIWIMSSGFAYTKLGEKYDPQVLDMLKTIRKNYLLADLLKYGIYLIIFASLLLAYLSKKINFTKVGIALALLISFDLITVQSNYGEELTPKANIPNLSFSQNSVTNLLENDKDLFRIFPVGNLMNDNKWAAHAQSIGGYSAIKMYTVEELVQNCYYGGPDKNFPLNWNVLKFLNVKYVLLQQPIEHEYLDLVSSDQNSKLFLYKYTERLPRAFFVNNTKIIEDEYERLELINSSEFDATNTAILEEQLSTDVFSPDSNFVKVLDYHPNKLSLDVYTDKKSLLAISEIYYPPGWKVYIDGNEVNEIYKTNHAIQSVVVEEGNHKVEVAFEPDSFFLYKNVGWASVSIIYLIIGISLLLSFKKKPVNN